MEEDQKNQKSIIPYNGRFPRALLLLGSLLGLFWIGGAYFNKGPMQMDSFGSYGKLIVALITYILLSLVAVRANFKCQKVSCPSAFIVIFLLAYYSYPPFLKFWGFGLVCIALYIIIKTLLRHKKHLASE